MFIHFSQVKGERQEKEDLKECQVIWESPVKMEHQDCQVRQDRGDSQEFMVFQGHL
jgi:hypothetical protein